MLKPVRFVFYVIIMVIPSILCYPSFLAISYRSTWYFRMFPLVSLRFARVFLLFPLSVSPVSYFRFCLKRPLLLQCILFITHISLYFRTVQIHQTMTEKIVNIYWRIFVLLINTRIWPTWWNSPCRGEGAYPLRSFIQVRQRGELNWTSKLQPSGQQIFSIVTSRPESILIR